MDRALAPPTNPAEIHMMFTACNHAAYELGITLALWHELFKLGATTSWMSDAAWRRMTLFWASSSPDRATASYEPNSPAHYASGQFSFIGEILKSSIDQCLCVV